MATYLKPGVDVRPGKSAVDELFERGSEILDEEYVQGVKSAAQGRVLQIRIELIENTFFKPVCLGSH